MLVKMDPPGWPTPTRGDFHIADFRFDQGGALPDLRIHYQTLGTPRRDEHGRTANAVLIMHGTGGSSDHPST
ncbi:hypothetical protein VTK73DRAFT_5625 [Phialemonium thermophilum]|uniref:Alpha/beta hydrolase n=1 Tax=Phialemonium thermophilum TaxID=223376 RepID=A0ABR3V113_9PEZI